MTTEMVARAMVGRRTCHRTVEAAAAAEVDLRAAMVVAALAAEAMEARHSAVVVKAVFLPSEVAVVVHRDLHTEVAEAVEVAAVQEEFPRLDNKEEMMKNEKFSKCSLECAWVIFQSLSSRRTSRKPELSKLGSSFSVCASALSTSSSKRTGTT